MNVIGIFKDFSGKKQEKQNGDERKCERCLGKLNVLISDIMETAVRF
jgi:hypothetical protein